MKKLISYTLIASMLSASLMGCANNKPPQNIVVFGQDTYNQNYKDLTLNNNFTLKKSEDSHQEYVKELADGGKIEVDRYNSSKYSDITKTSKKYNDYLSCITDFNKDNKSILEIIEKADKNKKKDDNTYAYYGGSKFKFHTNACKESGLKSDAVKEYQYVIDIEGANDQDAKETLSTIGEVTIAVILSPIYVVVFIVFFPIFMIGMCMAYCFK